MHPAAADAAAVAVVVAASAVRKPQRKRIECLIIMWSSLRLRGAHTHDVVEWQLQTAATCRSQPPTALSQAHMRELIVYELRVRNKHNMTPLQTLRTTNVRRHMRSIQKLQIVVSKPLCSDAKMPKMLCYCAVS